MFYWQDLNLISISYLQGVLNRIMARFTTTVDMQDQKKRQPRRFWYHSIAFKASIMSENRNNTHTHTQSEPTGWWTRSSLGSFKTQNVINLECFSYPKQLQLNLDPPLACLKRLAEFHLNRAYIPQGDLVDIFGGPTVLEKYATTLVEQVNQQGLKYYCRLHYTSLCSGCFRSGNVHLRSCKRNDNHRLRFLRKRKGTTETTGKNRVPLSNECSWDPVWWRILFILDSKDCSPDKSPCNLQKGQPFEHESHLPSTSTSSCLTFVFDIWVGILPLPFSISSACRMPGYNFSPILWSPKVETPFVFRQRTIPTSRSSFGPMRSRHLIVGGSKLTVGRFLGNAHDREVSGGCREVDLD